VRFPAKDINELIQERGYDDARKILKTAYEDAKWQAPEQLRTVVEFEDELDAFFDAKENDSGGFRSGFEKFDENDVRFREHDLWLVAGFSGSGKSMMLNQLCLNAITQDRKILIASMEMTPRYTLGRMLMQTCGVRKPEKDWRKKALDWLAPNLWLFVDDLTPKPADLLRTFEYGYRRYGINVFVIDSLTNMVRQDDYEGQQKFVEALVQFKLKFNVTIFLVAHARKQENESRAPGKFDIKGSSAISDLCDGAFSVWKNKPKAEHLEACRIFNEPVNEDIAKSWDIHLEVLKNRHGMWEGKIGFDFEEGSCQYLERRPSIPKAYVPKPKEKLF
jgi:twinkle protein